MRPVRGDTRENKLRTVPEPRKNSAYNAAIAVSCSDDATHGPQCFFAITFSIQSAIIASVSGSNVSSIAAYSDGEPVLACWNR